jgi:hypothetical protein
MRRIMHLIRLWLRLLRLLINRGHVLLLMLLLLCRLGSRLGHKMLCGH